MKSPDLENIRECCNSPKTHLIFYDGADTADLPILICDDCIGNLIFQQFIVSRFILTKKTDIDQILKNYHVI